MDEYLDRLTPIGTAFDPKGNVLTTFTCSTSNPSLAMVGPAVRLSHWSYDRMIRLTFRHHSASRELLDALLATHLRSQASVPAAVMATTSRNKPCPCGLPGPSGTVPKAKHCHGGQSWPLDEVEGALTRREFAEFPTWEPTGESAGS